MADGVFVTGIDTDIGKTLIYGLIITIPAVIFAGPLLGRFMKRIEVDIQSFFLSKEKKTQKFIVRG